MSKLTLEVFRDDAIPDLRLDAAYGGFELLCRSTDALEMVQDTRQLRLARDDQETINTFKIRWPDLQADMTLVLTNRTLYVPPEERREHATIAGTVGIVHRDQNVAVVNVESAGPNAPVAVAHEIGHLLGLKSKGRTYNGFDHCLVGSCAMYSLHSRQPIELMKRPKTPRHLMAGLLERCGLKEPLPPLSAFCGECSYQLDEAAFYLRRAKGDGCSNLYPKSQVAVY